MINFVELNCSEADLHENDNVKDEIDLSFGMSPRNQAITGIAIMALGVLFAAAALTLCISFPPITFSAISIVMICCLIPIFGGAAFFSTLIAIAGYAITADAFSNK